MDKSCDFLLGAPDPEIAGRLSNLEAPAQVLDRRFTQEEDFFLTLDRPYVVEPFEIHHNVRVPRPSERYQKAMRALVAAWATLVPGVFTGLSWYFQPDDLFHPLFLQPLVSRGKRFLFVLRPDLTFRGRRGDILEPGGNDLTPRFSTRQLFLEAEVVPLASWETRPEGRVLNLARLFENTFVGEKGLGYLRTGQWIDREISRLLSRAALAAGVRFFPFQPLRCHRATLAVGCADLTETGRKHAAATLELAWTLVSPWAETVQRTLKTDPYRDDHPLILQLRERWNHALEDRWGPIRIEPYLNEFDQKEYRYHGV